MATTEELYTQERALWFNYFIQSGVPTDIANQRADHYISNFKKSRAAAKTAEDNRKAGITPQTPTHDPVTAMKNIDAFYEANPVHKRGF